MRPRPAGRRLRFLCFSVNTFVLFRAPRAISPSTGEEANFPPPLPSPVHLPRRMLWVIRIINTLSRSLQSPAVISNLSLGMSFSYQTLASCLQGVPDLPCVPAPSRLPTGPTSGTHTLPEVMNRYIYTLTAYTCTLLT